jgi:predicted Zn finger-like uncharacterized protein
MLIQCQTCNSKYRLNLERIPNRKTFIKCKKCNAPIYIDPQEESLESPGIIHPQGPPGGAAAGQAGEATVVVECDNCDARYRVPVLHLRKPGLKLKCTRCGHTFPVPEGTIIPAEPAMEMPTAGEPGGAPEFFPAAGPEGEPLGAQAREMPVPDDTRIDALFDDLKVDDAAAQEGAASLEATAAESEQAYLEAVSFSEGGAPAQPPKGGGISDEQKYRFFLKPGEGAVQMTEESGAQTETGPAGAVGETDAELPPLPMDGQEPAPISADEPWAADGEIPPFESEFPEETGMTETTDTMELDPSLPALPAEDEDRFREAHGDNQAVPGQDAKRTRMENRKFFAMAAAVAAVLLVSAGWGLWIWTLPPASAAYTVREGSPQELAVTATRQGYFINNKPSGERLYVMTGQVVNRFTGKDRIGWVRVKGVVHTNSAKVTYEGHAYLGNLLNDDQLASWELNAIQAFYGYTNGRNDINLDIPEGKDVPYQIVLKGVNPPVTRTEALVVSFMRQGRPVYLEHF